MSLRRDLKIQELNQVTEIIYDQNLNVIVYVLIVYISQPTILRVAHCLDT